ncbi:MAG: decaprenyl-phosphate phosphoribosyltransferase [Ignavibacterium sp.]|nr:decaprenyl-phosphate phosphoribosyltransferase [Ignavibacterium sp.]MCX7611669.1 decaprenyl-phosphate phosphoribosyltransferase [Ignavibacterium sp.]MDW8375849.1 decaprenyl-phosphate phosphoribosyltransferase [Ignavibacteriales bacterium]
MIKDFIKLIRVKHWIKNFFVFIPLIFSLHLFHYDYFIASLITFILFSFASSAIYVFNDIVDVENDKQHPVKKNRPIAAGKIKIKTAYLIFVLLISAVLIFSFQFNYKVFLSLLVFILINVVYTIKLKQVVLLDIFSIAAGFSIRVYSGAIAIDVQISSWLILSTIFISLFLAVMKRRSELKRFENESEKRTRKVLESYSIDFTDQMATVAASGLITCYALYTVAERTVNVFGTEDLIYTTPFVVFGIFRFMYLEYINQKGENTTEIILTDIPTIMNVILYLITCIAIIYKFV